MATTSYDFGTSLARNIDFLFLIEAHSKEFGTAATQIIGFLVENVLFMKTNRWGELSSATQLGVSVLSKF